MTQKQAVERAFRAIPRKESLITTSNVGSKKKFYVELIKPSHYDDDGYVIQWAKAWIPTNSLACCDVLLIGFSINKCVPARSRSIPTA